MEEDVQKELQLLSSSHMASDSPLLRFRSMKSTTTTTWSSSSTEGTPSLDLQLSISVRPVRPSSGCEHKDGGGSVNLEALKWQSAEQIRLAAMEKAYAQRVKELTRREMEMAQSEFARAKQMWERAREEVERAERMKERATRHCIGSAKCMEITCQSCRQRFRP